MGKYYIFSNFLFILFIIINISRYAERRTDKTHCDVWNSPQILLAFTLMWDNNQDKIFFLSVIQFTWFNSPVFVSFMCVSIPSEEDSIPCPFVSFFEIHIFLCYWFYGITRLHKLNNLFYFFFSYFTTISFSPNNVSSRVFMLHLMSYIFVCELCVVCTWSKL